MKKQSKKIILIIFIIIISLLLTSKFCYASTEILSDEDYKYKILENGNIEIVGLTDKLFEEIEGVEGRREIEFPSTISGKTVEKISLTGARALSDIIVVKIPGTVKSLGRNVFSDCNNLVSVHIEDGLETIGANAFYNCKSLKQVKMPSTVKSIGELAFAYCESLEEIEIPSNVEYLPQQVFQNCKALNKVEFKEAEDGTTKIKLIGVHAFQNCVSLKSIDIPKSVTIINEFAFEGCNYLEKVKVRNKNLNFIGENIFTITKRDEHGTEHTIAIPNLTIYGYEQSTAYVYAEAREIKFEKLMGQVEKAGILMAEFGKECVDTYSNNFYYTLDKDSSVRKELVFSNKKDKVGYEGLTLECVGTLNFFVYQSTGLWSSNFDSSDPVYVKPKALVADDIFETILDGAKYTATELKTLYENGDLQQGDVIRLNDGFTHVAMCCGHNGSKLLIPEGSNGWNSHHLFFSSFSSWICRGQIYRIKEEAADKLTFLEDMNSVEEITEYAKALALAYMDGQTTYNGEILKRKTTDECKIEVEKEEEKIEDLIEEEVTIKDSNGEEIKEEILTNVKQGTTVEQIMALDLPEGYSSKKIFNQYGGDVTNEKKNPLSTGMKIVYYTSAETGKAVDIKAGGEMPSKTFTFVLYGDVTGKGNPSALDALTIVKNKVGKISFKDPIYNISGRVTEETRKNEREPASVDAYAIVRAKMGKYVIKQGKFKEETAEQPEIVDYDDNVIPIYTRAELEKVGSGEEVLIETISELVTMKTTSKYVLMNDIDLSDSPWTPIGLPELRDESGQIVRKSTILTNTFEGNGHKITGMKITGEQGTKDIGLFAVSSAEINHLTLENVEISDITYTEDATSVLNGTNQVNSGSGVLVGCLLVDENLKENKITINKCITEGGSRISSGGMIGCVYGENEDSGLVLQNCTNNVVIVEPYSAGFVKSTNSNIEIYNCINNANVAGAGFICALRDAFVTIYNSTNNGYANNSGFISNALDSTITINSSINNGVTNGSGFIQHVSTYSSSEPKEFNIYIRNCVNKGNISSGTGGICGDVECAKELKIINSSNLANISSGGYCYHSGGIIGNSYCESTIIENCENYGEVHGTREVGGIIGYSYKKAGNIEIRKCNNYGKIMGNTDSSDVGGIVGLVCGDEDYSLSIIDCINEGMYTGADIGGISGCIVHLEKAQIKNCSNNIYTSIVYRCKNCWWYNRRN